MMGVNESFIITKVGFAVKTAHAITNFGVLNKTFIELNSSNTTTAVGINKHFVITPIKKVEIAGASFKCSAVVQEWTN